MLPGETLTTDASLKLAYRPPAWLRASAVSGTNDRVSAEISQIGLKATTQKIEFPPYFRMNFMKIKLEALETRLQ
jgi:hypothetical protein